MNVLEYWESLSELRREQDRQWELSLQAEEKKMAKQIISKKDLDTLFPNELQKAAFLRIMDGLVIVLEIDLIEEIYDGVVALTPNGLRAKLEAHGYKIVRDT